MPGECLLVPDCLVLRQDSAGDNRVKQIPGQGEGTTGQLGAALLNSGIYCSHLEISGTTV